MFTPAGEKLGYRELEKARKPDRDKMTESESKRALLQADFATAILHPNLLILKQLEKLEELLLPLNSTNETVTPHTITTMNESIVEDLQKEFPQYETH